MAFNFKKIPFQDITDLKCLSVPHNYILVQDKDKWVTSLLLNCSQGDIWLQSSEPNPVYVPLLTCQIGVVDSLFDFGFFDYDDCVLGKKQLPCSCFVSFPVILDHRNCILK